MSAFAKVILDSISPEDIRLPTLHLRYWRPVHAEFMTHRVFTRNGRSSRAVPVKTLLTEAPYVPHFMKNQPGMVASEELSLDAFEEATVEWAKMIDACRKGVARLNELGVHKQWANRPLEWFGYIDVLLTTTDIENFYALRDHPDAQPEIKELAVLIKEALEVSTPTLLTPGEWHLPYVTRQELLDYGIETSKKLSAARCARLSYKPFDGNASIGAEIERYDRLITSKPVHASPVEHQATPDSIIDFGALGKGWRNEKYHGNFYGWIQNRKLIPDEAVFDRHYRR